MKTPCPMVAIVGRGDMFDPSLRVCGGIGCYTRKFASCSESIEKLRRQLKKGIGISSRRFSIPEIDSE
jgi:hypothetical protein